MLMNQIDLMLFRWLNSWVGINDFLDWNILFRAEYLLYVVILGVFAFFVFSFFARATKDEDKNQARWVTIHSFAAGILSRFIFTEIIRFFYFRPRPFTALESVRQLIFHAPSGSFPSGHAAFSFAVAASMAYYYPKTSILFFLGALAMGAGRVSAGVHWPSDILAGAIVGILSAWLIHFIIKKLRRL